VVRGAAEADHCPTGLQPGPRGGGAVAAGASQGGMVGMDKACGRR